MDRVDRETSGQQPGDTREVISLGGWCGPAEALRMLKIRKKALPFDYIHSSMQGINLIFSGNESVYFPLPGDARSRYTIYPHHDMQDEDTIKSMKKRFTSLWSCLADKKPALFIRTVVNPDYKKELQQAITFTRILKNKFQRNQDRLVLVFHDQGVGTVQLDPLAENIMCWSAEGKVGWHVADRDEIFHSYMKIISVAMKESNWPPHQQIKGHQLIAHNSREIHKSLFDERPDERPELSIDWASASDLPLAGAVSRNQPRAILIGGCPHSGTRLLDSVLNSHPDVCSISGQMTASNDRHRGNQTHSLSGLFDEQIYSLPDTCKYWCESSPANIFYIGDIIHLLGKEARIVNIIRDGRDVAVSEAGRQSWFARITPERWLDYMYAGNIYAKHPQVLCIKYEDIVSKYEMVVKQLCGFLDLEPVDEMMNFRESCVPQDGGDWYTGSKVCDDCSPIGSWQKGSANARVYKFLEWPGVVSALQLYGYIPRKRLILLRRVNRVIRRWVKSIR